MIDRSFINHELDPLTVDVERNRLVLFAKATGQDDPIYLEVGAAQAAGFSDLPVPPTFLFSLGLERSNPLKIYQDMGIDLAKILHGTQSFEYHAPICAGDRITLRERITDIYEKKGGALEFMVLETTATNQDGDTVATAKNTLVIRN